MNTSSAPDNKTKADMDPALWEQLEAAAAKYRVLSVTTRTVTVEAGSPDKKALAKQAARRLVFAGLRVRLSDVLAEVLAQDRVAPANGLSSLVVYADTLVVDKPIEIAAYNVLLVARSIDATALCGHPMVLQVLNNVKDIVLYDEKSGGGKPAKDAKPGGTLKQSIQILAGSIDGTLSLAAKKNNTLLNGRWVPEAGVPLRIELCRMGEDGALGPECKTTASALADIVKKPLALSAFKAALVAAGHLGRLDEESTTQQAVEMLQWVALCLRSGNTTTHDDELLFEELSDQVSSLLIPLRVTGKAYFVPTLSAEFYRAQMDQLLSALESYEGQLRGLEIRTDISASLNTVSDGMRVAAEMEIRPLKTELSMVRDNMRVLEQSIIELNRGFRAQSTECKKLYDTLDVAIRRTMDNNLVMEGFKLATDGISFIYNAQRLLIAKSKMAPGNTSVPPSLGHDAGGGSATMDDPDAGSSPHDDGYNADDVADFDTAFDASGSPHDAELDSNASNSSDGDTAVPKVAVQKSDLQNSRQLLDKLMLDKKKASLFSALKKYGLQTLAMAGAFARILQGPGINNALISKAQRLIEDQQKLTTTVIEAARAWEKALWSDVEVPGLPETLNANKIESGQKWDDFLREAEVSLKGLSSAQKEAAAYLSGLTALAEFGKAISSKTIVYCEQTARGTVLKAQIAATTHIAAAWQSQQDRSQSETEKLAALKGMIELRADSIRQSIHVAWTYYRNSYLYLYFRKPPVLIGPDMNASQLRDGLNGVSRWVARMLGEDGASSVVTMPSRQARIVFELPVVKPGDIAPSAAQVARLEPATGGRGAQLRWTIPLGGSLAEGPENPLAGVLPQGGDVAIWVEEAKLVLEGVKPNAKGNGIVWLGTSGYYQNGFGRQEAYCFVNRPIGAYYCFQGQETYVPWTVQTGVYQMPTPFTQWTATFDKHGGDPSEVTKIRLELVISFRGRT